MTVWSVRQPLACHSATARIAIPPPDYEHVTAQPVQIAQTTTTATATTMNNSKYSHRSNAIIVCNLWYDCTLLLL